MNGSTSIFDFIDGALDPTREQALFDELARHPEMRAELRHYIAIGEAVRADREAYMPPAEVEHALMSGIGLAPIATLGGAGAAAAGTAGAGLLARIAMFRRMAPLAGAFVLGMLVATGGFFAAYTGMQTAPLAGVRDTIVIHEMAPLAVAPAEPRIAEPQPPAASQALAGAAAVERAPEAVTSTDSDRQSSVVQTVDLASQTTMVAPIDRVVDETSTTAIGSDELAAAMGRRAASVLARGFETPNERANDLGASGDTEAPIDVRGLDRNGEMFAAIMQTRELATASMEFRIHPFMEPFVDNNAQKVESAMTDEWTAGIFGRVGETFVVGVEGGAGRYPQVLVYPENYSSNGRPVGREIARIEQDPNVVWIGLSGRQELGTIGVGAPYWVQATVGYGFMQGPILNTRAGLSLDVARGVSINGALETTSLVYFFNGQPLYSGKYGVSVGAQVGF